MFGMSSKEFWEEDPQLYWAYRTFYLRKIENDYKQQDNICWLEGNYNYIAVATALNNAFSKKKTKYIEKPLSDKKEKTKTELQEKMEKEKDKNIRQQIEFNYWARL